MSRKRGFSLAEMVLAVSILALGVMVIINLLPVSIITLHRAWDLQAATAYGLEVLEGARSDATQATPRTWDVYLNNTHLHVVRNIYAAEPTLVDVVVTLQDDRQHTICLGTRVSGGSGP